MRIFFILFFIMLFFPAFASAQVLINEIAWMGSANSANEEWLELYNSGAEDVDFSGWTLEAQDGSPKISLSGIIKQNGYFLLERSSDSSVPSVPADIIYTGAMSNSGEILILKNSAGTEVDRADGSNGWASIGGNNETKETAQRTETGWTTATPSPKAKMQKPMQNNPPSQDAAARQGADEKVENVKANAGGNVVAQVGQSIFFDASQSEGAGASFSWNMGNGEVKEGKSFLYSYNFPGKYLLTLFAKNGASESKDQIDVTIYPAGVYISEFFAGVDGDGWIEIYNESENFVSMSGWGLINGGSVFTIPEGTLISSDGYLVFSEKTLGHDFIKNSGELVLIYPNSQAADKVEYENKSLSFSASRKNKEEFVWTEYKTPGFENVTALQGEEKSPESAGQVKTNIGVSQNLMQKNQASFVKVNSERSFLVTPAYAKVTDEPIVFQNDKNNPNLTANVSSLFSGNFIYIALLAIVLLLLAFIYKKLNAIR